MNSIKHKLRQLAAKAFALSKKIHKSPHTKNVGGFAVAGLAAAAIWAYSQTGTEPAHPIAVYQANESAEDSSGQGWNASNPEEAQFAEGREGSAFDFIRPDALGIKTEMDVSPNTHPSMTWSAWVLPYQITDRKTILSADKANFGRTLLIRNGRFGAFTGYGLFSPDAIAEVGIWAHIVVVFEPDQIRLYKNGEEFISRTPPRYESESNPLVIGRNPGFSHDYGEPFRGLIDQVEIFDCALSSTEVAGLYNKLNTQTSAIPPEAVSVQVQEQVQEQEQPAEVVTNELPEESTELPKESAELPAESQISTAGVNPSQNNPLPRDQEPLAEASGLAAEIAQRVVMEKWDEPQTLPEKPDEWKIDGYRNPGGKSRSYDYLGSVTLVLFLDGGKVESPILEAAERLQEDGLKVVVLTPAFPAKPKVRGEKEASVEAGMRALIPTIPSNATILSDPYGSVRYQLNLFATPAMLFDKKGRILWKVRIGQRETLDNVEEFEKVAKLALADQIKDASKQISQRSMRTEEKEIFGFESGWEGWTIAGDAWNPQDDTIQEPSSERHIPGLVAGYLGHRWISSFAGAFSPGTGTATSPEFEITAPFLHFLMGGGDIPQNAGIALEVDGKFVRSFTPSESTYELKPTKWDVSAFIGKKAKIIVYDSGQKEQRDGIMADAFTLSNSPEVPQAFANRHDPNEPAHVARVAADLPEIWGELLAGNFYQKAIPTWTFEIERLDDAKSQSNVRKLTFVEIGLPTKTPIQKTLSQKVSIEVDGIAGTSRTENLEGTYYMKEMLTAENSRLPKKSLQVRISAKVAISEFILEMGKNSHYEDLSEKESRATTNNPLPKDITSFFKKENILRWANEKDQAYILRVWRHLQRYYFGWGEWGGWPLHKMMKIGEQASQMRTLNPEVAKLETLANTWLGDLHAKSLDCPAVHLFSDLARSANIPVIKGQGSWISKEIGAESVGHVRAVIFLEGSGWILLDDEKGVASQYGQFKEGHKTGDTYFQYLDEKWTFGARSNLNLPIWETRPGVYWTTKSAVRTDEKNSVP